jgi:DNA adenine methylase
MEKKILPMTKLLKTVSHAGPFLKWAGGKTQLLRQLSKRLPNEMKKGEITHYVEPFVGGGAMFFYLRHRFFFTHCSIFDANEELILTWRVIKKSSKKLIHELELLESAYISKSTIEKERFYYHIRDSFNIKKPEINFQTYDAEWVTRAAQSIFLNRTCYNGLFRMNRKGEFNVPFGRYKTPRILNKDNLKDVAALLKTTTILSGDFTRCKKIVDNTTFVYLDPPYRPLNDTSSFTTYSKDGFSDIDQRRLAGFFKELDKKGAKIMLSNSDPRNENPEDSFFDELYAGYTIERIPAKRIINCNGARRGEINELIITNYR